MKSRLCFATNNKHKLAEVAALLSSHFHLVSLSDIGFNEELAEDFHTLKENSKQKAQFIFNKFHVPCFADDSGLEVEALNGEPGVSSAHYAGPQRNADDNMNLLLNNLSGHENRNARFRTVITLIENEDSIKQFEGVVEGIILKEKKGSDGFGYDPIFQPNGFSKSLAELTLDEKNKISHRAKAVKKLVEYLNSLR